MVVSESPALHDIPRACATTGALLQLDLTSTDSNFSSLLLSLGCRGRPRLGISCPRRHEILLLTLDLDSVKVQGVIVASERPTMVTPARP